MLASQPSLTSRRLWLTHLCYAFPILTSHSLARQMRVEPQWGSCYSRNTNPLPSSATNSHPKLTVPQTPCHPTNTNSDLAEIPPPTNGLWLWDQVLSREGEFCHWCLSPSWWYPTRWKNSSSCMRRIDNIHPYFKTWLRTHWHDLTTPSNMTYYS